MKNIKLIINMLFLVAAAIVLTTCAVNPVTGKSQVMLMSESQEIQLGKNYDPEVISTFGEYSNDAILSFVKIKGAEMGKISHRPHLEYHFKLLDSPVVNAFAVPGGYIYLTRGILAQFNNEAELMGVLGHEMGHVTARHSASQQTKQQLGQILLIGGMMASERFAQYGQQAMQGMQLLFLKFSRDNEREADRLGVEYMSKVGYDGNKMADFFDVLNKLSMGSEHGGVPTFLSTHPDPGDRNNSVKNMSKFWQDSIKRQQWTVNTETYLKMIDGLVYGDDPRQGYIEGNTFYHPELKFRFNYPAEWQFQNSPLQVATAPKDGKAVVMFTIAKQKTPDEAAMSATKDYGLTVVESKSVNINGMPAVAVISKQVQQDESTGQQQSNQLLSYYINYNGTIYVFHGISAETDFPAYRPSIESTINSFASLTDPAKINVKPKRILVKTVTQPGTLNKVFESYGVPQKQMQELALLNNLDLTASVPSGKLIKIIGE
jgi:predicted Zn-dependent protease